MSCEKCGCPDCTAERMKQKPTEEQAYAELDKYVREFLSVTYPRQKEDESFAADVKILEAAINRLDWSRQTQ